MVPIRIGDKLINKNKIYKQIDEMLDLRAQGFSQSEVAKTFPIDRTFVSKVETLGEIRKGGRIALVAFPISNEEEIKTLCLKEGIEFSVIFTEKARWEFVENKTGPELLNEVMSLVAKLRNNDIVIVAASDMRINLAKALLDKQVIGIPLGESPIAEDKYLDPKIVLDIMKTLKEQD